MKQMKDYEYFIPLWIREDESFNIFYKGILQIMLDCQETKDNIINSLTMKELGNYDESLEIIASYFGINRNFYLPLGNEIESIFKDSLGDYDYTYNENVPINIHIPNNTLLRMIKFKLLQSNFDGTIKNLLDNYNSLFEGEIVIQFIESFVEKEGKIYPELTLNLVLDERVTTEEATLFINGAYSFNYLGVVTKYSLGGRTIELIWDESDWDRSKWKI